MRIPNFILYFILLTSLSLTASAQKKIEYPAAPKDSIYNAYFDTLIHDPYQWMENSDDPRLQTWLDAQNKITKKLKNQQTNIWTLRNQIATLYHKTREEEYNGYEYKENPNKYEFEYKHRNYSKSPDFRYRKTGEGNFFTIIRGKDFQHDKDDNVIVTSWEVNPAENMVAIKVSHSGSDWQDVLIFDLINVKLLSDTLRYLRTGSSIIWDTKGFYYDRYQQPKEGREHLDIAKGQTLYYHKLGTNQTTDKLLYQNPDTTGFKSFRLGKLDSTRLVLYHEIKLRSKEYQAMSSVDMNNGSSFLLKTFLTWPSDLSISLQPEMVFGDTLILSTTWNAPNGKIMIADLNQANYLKDFIPEYDVVLRQVNRLGKDKISCIYRNGGKFLALIYNTKGDLLSKMNFPEGKKIKYLYEDNPKATSTLYCISSFFHPDLWFELSLKDLNYKPVSKIYVPYDPHSLETRYVTYQSKDGTQIPMYITCKKDVKLNGKNPTLLYGYGGYGTTLEPSYNEPLTLWLLHGGVLAIPNIRGGGAAGSEWAKSGRGLKKQNAIDDFNAAAEYLISKKYTSNQKLGSNGESHGGLLVSAAMVQRPDLYKAVIAEAAPLDMLRFEKFTIGSSLTSKREFGSTSTKEEFKNLLTYSPMHNIKPDENYPNLLLITGNIDDRVPPLHSYKFLATMQDLASDESQSHLYLVPGAGHGGALTQVDWEDKLLYKYYFLFEQLY